MSTLHERSLTSTVTALPQAFDALLSEAPELAESAILRQWQDFPIKWVLGLALGESDPRIPTMIQRLSTVRDPRAAIADHHLPKPSPHYEGEEVPRGSAHCTFPSATELHAPVEITLEGPRHGNPFLEVDLSAEFSEGVQTVQVGGFYDGEGRYLIRFLAPRTGTWQFVTASNARSLDGISGQVSVQSSARPGPVQVHDQFHFAHADGTPYRPVGTTAYAWIHQGDRLAEETLRSLADAPFTKLRMCVFPKHFLYNDNEPERFPWERSGATFDWTRFDTTFWRGLDKQIQLLGELGIQADLILFHPYDRWGFATLPPSIEKLYLRYVVRRLSAFPNIWWSLANEYELLHTKTDEDWDTIAEVVRGEDHVGHLLSIHNWAYVWDYGSDWATHCSIQYGENVATKVGEWRNAWSKPVIVDECGYDGDLDQGWGNLTPEVMTQQFWEATLAGGYATHGETIWHDDETIFWAKGGALEGDSPARIDFLSQLSDEAPGGHLDPLPAPFDALVGGVAGQYEIHYFGQRRPRFRSIEIPEEQPMLIDVVDTWNMTVSPLAGQHTGTVRVDLPARPWMAIRLRAA